MCAQPRRKEMGNNISTQKHSFDEFKLYYDSTEKVTDRRLDTNRWNYSICIAILVAIAVSAKWSLTNPSLIWIGFVAVAVLSGMAILFCLLWIGQIRDFKKLNNAKFAVLNEMAPKLEFHPDKPGQVVSYRPFDREWKKLSELDALSEIHKSNIVALKSSNLEYFIPKAFVLLFGSIILVLISVLIFQRPLGRLAQSSSPANSTNAAQPKQP
jgi:hypothetical protein